ncbi:MAG: flagellar motor switch protein FliN [Thiomonas sp.]|uniref:flagellar motor switch protein FliN n=1 Tax=Thiomonas sp. TaxID=2047785 RepID=UPI002A3592D3|nr:flagellar motor switch protein FliN [Thiomonas sp.]MDY0331354.1 flagellar motor switch protein FliN [Thiomonas sp.]
MAEDTPTHTAAADDLADWGEAMAEQGLAAAPAAAAAPEPKAKVQPAPFAELHADQDRAAHNEQLDLVMDIPVTLSVELGRTKIQIRELLQLAQGSVVDLDRLAGEPMDVLVNGFLIARGEVVLVNDKFGIRLTDIVSPTERARRLA